MSGPVHPATRHLQMAAIRCKDTLAEQVVRTYLHRCGLRFRLHDRLLPGSPDIVLPARRAAVFVHGCFWHRHEGCSWTTFPASNTAFWEAKFRANVSRDREAARRHLAMGWAVHVIWECETKQHLLLDRLAWVLLSEEQKKRSL